MRRHRLPLAALLIVGAALVWSTAHADVTRSAPLHPTGAGTAATAPSSSLPQPDSPVAGVELIASTVQSELQRLGYQPGPVDGQFAAQTQSALRASGAAHGVAAGERGALGPTTAAALTARVGGPTAVVAALQSALTTLYAHRVPEPIRDAGKVPSTGSRQPASLLKLGSDGAAVTALQKRLARLDYRPGPADGNFGPATASAVLAFQKRNGLARDAIVGPSVQAELTAPTGAGPRPGAKPRIEIDIARQIIFVVSRSGSVTSLNTSTGNGERYAVPGGGSDIADTPVGSFTVLRKSPTTSRHRSGPCTTRSTSTAAGPSTERQACRRTPPATDVRGSATPTRTGSIRGSHRAPRSSSMTPRAGVPP